MNPSTLRDRRLVSAFCMGIVLGMFPLGGCAATRAADDLASARQPTHFSFASYPGDEASAPTVLHINEESFERHVLQSDVPVLVDFYASWCGPCKKMAPALDQLAAETPQARVVKVNVDDNPKLAARYGVKSLPSLLVFKKGQVVTRQKGVVTKSKLKAMLAL